MQGNVAVVSGSPCKSLEINKSLDKVKKRKEKEIKIKYHHQKKRKRKVMMMTMMEYPMMHRQNHQKTLAAAQAYETYFIDQ